MRLELHFNEYKSFILNLELTNFTYFFIGLAVGFFVFLAYKYFFIKN